MDNTRASPELLRQLTNLAALFTASAAWMLMAIALMRSGLGDTTGNQLSTWIFLCLSIWLPVYAISKAKKNWIEVGAIASTVGAIFPVLGLFLGPIAAFIAFAMLCVVAVHLRGSWHRNGQPVFWRILGGSVLLAIVLLSMGSAGRFFLPEEMAMGSAHSDAYFHIAIANMISKFQVPSIGADGLELTKYHFGSHFVAAGLAKASGTRVSEVYVYWGAVTLKMQLIWSILWCSLHLLWSHSYPSRIRGRLLLSMVFVVFAAPFFDSESFLLACAIFLGSVPLISSHLTTPSQSGSRRWGQFSIILVSAFVCAAAKVSVGYFVAVLLIYASYLNFKDTKRVAMTFAGLCALAVCTLILFHPSDVSLLSGGREILLASYLQYATLTTLLSFLLPMVILSWQFVTLSQISTSEHGRNGNLNVSVSYRKITNIADFFNVLAALKGEWQILCVSLMACILVVVTMPIGSNAAYFSGVLLFMSFALIPAGFFHVCGALHRYRLFKVVELVFIVALAVYVLTFSWQLKTRMQRVVACEGCQTGANAGAAEASAIQLTPTERVLSSLREHRTLWTTSRARIDASQWSVMIRDIEQFAINRPGAMVFVPPSNEDFWTRLKPGNPYWCISPQLMIPAQTGVPMLRGISPARFEPECMPAGLLWYGFGKHQEEHRTGEFDDKALCALTVSKGFNRVYILNSIGNIGQNRKLSCP
jgi:hypothetical protein